MPTDGHRRPGHTQAKPADASRFSSLFAFFLLGCDLVSGGHFYELGECSQPSIDLQKQVGSRGILMVRFSFFQAFIFSAFVLFAAPVFAADPGCSSQLFQGSAPTIKSEKLAEQTHPICFSEIAVLYSGISRTPLWSAEHLTPARIERARNLPEASLERLPRRAKTARGRAFRAFRLPAQRLRPRPHGAEWRHVDARGPGKVVFAREHDPARSVQQ